MLCAGGRKANVRFDPPAGNLLPSKDEGLQEKTGCVPVLARGPLCAGCSHGCKADGPDSFWEILPTPNARARPRGGRADTVVSLELREDWPREEGKGDAYSPKTSAGFPLISEQRRARDRRTETLRQEWGAQPAAKASDSRLTQGQSESLSWRICMTGKGSISRIPTFTHEESKLQANLINLQLEESGPSRL